MTSLKRLWRWIKREELVYYGPITYSEHVTKTINQACFDVWARILKEEMEKANPTIKLLKKDKK